MAAVNWEKVARAETHPLRIQILEELARSGEPQSATTLSAALGEKLGNVAYHLGDRGGLAEKGLVAFHHSKPRRGALEKFYVLAEGGVKA
jgi:DNA-binding transcriptional ArsR family regulator